MGHAVIEETWIHLQSVQRSSRWIHRHPGLQGCPTKVSADLLQQKQRLAENTRSHATTTQVKRY